MTTADTVRGRVEARNPNGIRVAGEWHNVSKFRPLDLPAVGANVELGIDPKGFITSLEVLEGAPAPANLSPMSGMRLEVLQAAASFLGQLSHTRPEVRSEHVLALADRWLAWVERERAAQETDA